MREFRSKTFVMLSNGKKAIIENLLGSGGQGYVYLVKVDGKPMAMKWYKRSPSESFYENLMKNVMEGAPSKEFLWPVAVCKRMKGSCGYVMPLKPEDYYDFSDFLMAKVRFSSWHAVLNAAIKVCKGFKALHAQGLSYQDLNDGNFFINPQTGDVLIADNDNVFPHGEQSGILGKARYMAPEVVIGETMPNTYSDRFSLAIILYMFFCNDHPFEGRNVLRHPCLTEEIERRLFGKEILFTYDANDQKNRPVRGIHNNSITFWPLLPALLRDTFTKEFSAERIWHPEQRMTEMEWIDILQKVRDMCINDRFVEGEPPFSLKGKNRQIPLAKGAELYIDSDNSPYARVVCKSSVPDVLYLMNISSETWNVTTPSGKTVAIAPKGVMPVKNNLQITFNKDNEQFTIYKNQ